MVKVSIIVPVYNTASYLEKCLDSLVNQTLKEIEIIVVNDGSSDNSQDIIDDYIKKYPNLIKGFKNKNLGISKTRNFGITKAKGQYIAFIDSDDYVDVNVFLDGYEFASLNDLDIVVWDFYKYFENSKRIEEVRTPDFKISSIKDNPKLIFEINYAPWNKLYKREIFNKFEFPVIKYEDFAILPQILCSVQKIGKINKCYNYYLVRNNSETTIMDDKVFDILKILNKQYLFFMDNGLLSSYAMEFEYYFIYRLTMYIIQQRYQKNRVIANKFIDEAYDFLDSKFPNWRLNLYYKKNKLKLLIEKNKGLAKFYCDIYRIFK